jgi:uncharacterized membrane protein
MMPASSDAYRRAALLGLVAGLRSLTPLALLAAAGNLPAPDRAFGASSPWPVSLLQAPAVLRGIGLAAAGELVGDKLPFIPSRVAAPVFGWRLAVGAAVGAAVCEDEGLPVVPGAAVGAVAAVVGTVAGYRARTTLSRATPVPDPVWGLAGDAIALGVGIYALRRYLFA